MNPADLNLIQRCCAKDPKAWDEFVERYSHLIYDAVIRTLERYGYSRRGDVLADLHNDIFVLIIEDECRVLKQFEGRNGCQLAHYLRTVAVRRTVDFLRKIRPTVSLDEDPLDEQGGFTFVPVASQGADGAAALISRERHSLLEHFLSELSAHEREFCRMLIVDGLTSEEMALRMGISVDYFYVRKKRLMDKLRQMAQERERVEKEVSG